MKIRIASRLVKKSQLGHNRPENSLEIQVKDTHLVPIVLRQRRICPWTHHPFAGLVLGGFRVRLLRLGQTEEFAQCPRWPQLKHLSAGTGCLARKD